MSFGPITDGYFDQGLKVQLCPICGEECVIEAEGELSNFGGEIHTCPERE